MGLAPVCGAAECLLNRSPAGRRRFHARNGLTAWWSDGRRRCCQLRRVDRDLTPGLRWSGAPPPTFPEIRISRDRRASRRSSTSTIPWLSAVARSPTRRSAHRSSTNPQKSPPSNTERGWSGSPLGCCPGSETKWRPIARGALRSRRARSPSPDPVGPYQALVHALAVAAGTSRQAGRLHNDE